MKNSYQDIKKNGIYSMPDFNRRTIQLMLFTGIVSLFFCACKKALEVKLPVDELVTAAVFADSTTAQAAVSGMYSQMYNGSGTGASIFSYRISTLPGESADELTPVSNNFDQFATNSLIATNSDVSDMWSQSYNIIYLANSIVQGLQTSTTVSASLKAQLTGEAKFVRAFCYFYLVNYFGKVPLLTTNDINVTKNAGQSSTDEVYAQIITDLKDARGVLAKDYSWSGGDRTRVNSYVASAMLARVYLYTGQWALAETEATNVINQNSLYSIITDPDKVFLANSNEAIWQFYTNVYGYTYFAQQFIPTGNGVPTYTVAPTLLKTFEKGDLRKTKWLDSVAVLGQVYWFPYKYKSITNDNSEFDMVMRLSEQYLIRSEARAEQNNTNGAIADINAIRSRAGLPATMAKDQASLLTAILHERQAELFCEYGHRWLDLKRTNQANAVLKMEKPLGWQATDVLYPIPQSALSTNPKLTQNTGY